MECVCISVLNTKDYLRPVVQSTSSTLFEVSPKYQAHSSDAKRSNSQKKN
jgi:hypothetical protein